MKLNLVKCAFSVNVRIKVNLTQVKAILKTPTLNSKKELQHLTNHFLALGRFIARFIDKLKLFFLTLKGANRFN